jgi:hypothetical protein
MIQPRRGRVVHAVPGRVRVRLDEGGLSEDTAARLRSAIETVPGVVSVRANPRTASLVIQYDPDSLDVGAVIARSRAANLLVELPDPDAHGPPVMPPSEVATRIQRAFGDIDARLHELSAGRWNLRSVVPAAFGVLALRAILRDPGALAAAPWYVLAWYAFDSFIKLHQEPKVIQVQPPQPTTPDQE